MKRVCKNCQFWVRFKTFLGVSDWLGLCISGKITYEPEDMIMESDGLYYDDLGGYKLNVKTGKDFGCIHFQPTRAKARIDSKTQEVSRYDSTLGDADGQDHRGRRRDERNASCPRT